MRVVSLFDGMGCGYESLKRAGIPVDVYYASEIEKYPMTIAKKNHPWIVHMGDVENWKEWTIDWSKIDLLIAGSPCQGFSFAGKQLAFDDPRSKLFFVFVDILNHIRSVNPNVKFLLENVKMKKEYLDIISEQVGVEPVFINSALVSAQNRQRYYWANWEFGQPDDLGIKLVSVLEDDPLEFTLMSDKFVNRQSGRACLMDASKEKAANLSAMEYVKNGRQGDYLLCDIKGGAIRGRYLIDGVRQDGHMKVAGLTKQMLEVRDDDKTNALTTVQKDTVVVKECGVKTYNRKLTTIECERLQTLPDNYTEGVSNTQRYKMLGNGWTVSVIAFIIKQLVQQNDELI